jgi:hypothetical protein
VPERCSTERARTEPVAPRDELASFFDEPVTIFQILRRPLRFFDAFSSAARSASN